MADLGNLSFGILYKDDPKQLDKIKERALKKLQDMNLVTKVSGSINKTDLVKSVKDALGSEQFKIGVIVDKANAAKAVRDALDKAGLNTNYSASDLRAERARAEAAKSEAYVNAQRELARQRAAAATKAELSLAAARERSANAARVHTSATLNMNGAMKSQLSVSGELRDQILALYSVYTLERFVKGLIEIGGEFEKQELALSAMLNDAGKAHEVFGQIKNLAVVSPFGVRELNDYTKQLKAFSIPYNELYETTKRLADISAGVGVDMGRIILAYGQVRSAAFLRGQELRQFTEAGIPMVDALADKFSKLESRVVSAGEVIDMISKKKVSFEDVQDVLWGMTDDGGKFHNMQEVLSESLSAKWKNLGDAIDIMMADIAMSSNGILKGVAEGLTTLTSNWEALIPVIEAAVIVFGNQRVATFAMNRAMGDENSLLIKSTLAAKQKAASNLIVAQSYRTLTAAEKGVIASSRVMSTADWQSIASSGQLTKEYALRMMALGKLTRWQAVHIAQTLNISKAEMAAAFSAGRSTVMMYGLGAGIRSVGLALKSLVWNPYTALFAGIALILSGWQKMEQKADDMEQRIKDLSQIAQDGYKNLKSQVEKFDKVNVGSINSDGLITSIKEIQEVLKDYAPDANGILKEADSISKLSDKYKFLHERLIEVRDGYEILNDIKSASENANEATDGYWDDSFLENVEQYVKAVSKADKELVGIAKYQIEVGNAINEAAKGNTEFEKAINGKNLEQQIRIMYSYTDVWQNVASSLTRSSSGASKILGDFYYANKHAVSQLNNDVLPDLKAYADSLKGQLEMEGWDFSALTNAQMNALKLSVNDFLSKVPGITSEIQNKLRTQILTVRYGIKYEIEEYNPKDNFTTLAQQIYDAQEKLLNANGGGLLDDTEKKKWQFFTEKEIEDIGKSGDSVNKALKDLLEERKTAWKSLENIKGQEEQAKEAKDSYDRTLQFVDSILKKRPDVKEDKEKDHALELLKERFKQLQDFISMYEKLSDSYGKVDALRRTKESGLFASGLFKDSTTGSITGDVQKEIEKILKESGNKTKDRRSLTESALSYNIDLGVKVDKENLQKAVTEIGKYISDTTKKWDIYKNALNSTNNEKLAMQLAFGGNVSFGNVTDELQAKIQEMMQGDKRVNIDFATLVGMNIKDIEQSFGKPLANLVKSWQEETGKLKEETVKNFLDILKRSADFGEQIAAIDAKLQKDIADLENNSQNLSNEDVERRRKFLTDEANKEKSSVRFEEFKQTSDWVKVFDDLDRVSTSTLNEMIEKISEFAQQAGLSEKVTKQLVEAMRKLREESINRNPFQGLLNAINNHSKWNFAKDRLGNNDSFTFKRDEGGFKKGQTITKKDVDNGLAESNDDMEKSALDIANKFKAVADAADMLGGMFENLGVNMDGFLGGITDILGGAASGAQAGAGIASALGAAGPWGAAAGAAVGMLSAVFALHDKKQEKIINESKQRVKELENLYDLIDKKLEYSLGSGASVKLLDAENDKIQLDKVNARIDSIRRKDKISIFDIMALSKYSKESEKLQKRVKAYNEGGAYGYQRALMQEQMSELEKQRQAEIDKKKTDDGKVADYENQIAELKQQIKDFAEEMADSLYGINLKDWASQLGDALYEAWQKGEDGAEAFKKKAAEIMGDVMNSVLKLAILEPAMKNLQTMLFGEDGQSGMFGKDFKLDNSELENIADYLMGVSSKTDDYYDALDKLNEYMEKKYGVSMKEEAESSGLSKGIEGVTEDTANLLASYLNSVRSDVAMKLQLVRQIVDEYFPRANFLAEAQLTELKAISRNTSSNVVLVTEIRDMLGAARLSKDRGFYLK